MALPESLHMERYYKDGFVPSSFDAPHSSLQRSSTWIAMGCILSSLAFFGMAIFGIATNTIGTEEHWGTFVTIGLIGGAIFLFGGFGLVRYGRRNYRDYVARSGRLH